MRASLKTFLGSHDLSTEGAGTKESPSPMQAINLAMSGRLSDNTPPTMSRVIGCWFMCEGDGLPHAIVNSRQWKDALLDAPGTGLMLEQERLSLVLDWLWGTVLPHLQAIADELGLGAAWESFLQYRNADGLPDTIYEDVLLGGIVDHSATATLTFNIKHNPEYATSEATGAALMVAEKCYEVGDTPAYNQAWDIFAPHAVLASLCKVRPPQ